MVETTNKFLNQSSTGAEVGTWGIPYNHNMTLLDNYFGGMTSIPLTNANVTLSSAQYQNVFISLTGTLSGSLDIIFPTVGSFYSVQNLTSNSSLFTVTLRTAAPTEVVCAPPGGDFVDIITDSANVRYRNLGRIGSYIDIASSFVPLWINGCTKKPYLYCNGATFSSASFPVLTTILGSTTLPDCRGRTRFSLDSGTNRNTTYMSGNNLMAVGGVESITHTMADTPYVVGSQADVGQTGSDRLLVAVDSAQPITNIPTAIMQGITLIRAG